LAFVWLLFLVVGGGGGCSVLGTLYSSLTPIHNLHPPPLLHPAYKLGWCVSWLGFFFFPPLFFGFVGWGGGAGGRRFLGFVGRVGALGGLVFWGVNLGGAWSRVCGLLGGVFFWGVLHYTRNSPPPTHPGFGGGGWGVCGSFPRATIDLLATKTKPLLESQWGGGFFCWPVVRAELRYPCFLPPGVPRPGVGVLAPTLHRPQRLFPHPHVFPNSPPRLGADLTLFMIKLLKTGVCFSSP